LRGGQLRGGGSGGLVEDDGFADDFGPAVVEGLYEFLSGEFLGLEHEVTEIGEGDGGLGLDESEGGGGEQSPEGGAEVAGGEDVAAEEFVDLLAGFLGAEVVAVFFGVEIAEVDVVGGWGHLAAAAVSEEKHTRAGAVLVNGHSGSPERLNFGCSGESAQEKSRAHFSTWEGWQLGMELSSRMLVKISREGTYRPGVHAAAGYLHNLIIDRGFRER
jgi:hypothetical protein